MSGVTHNPVRPDEWRLIEPLLPGVRKMLELGNKVNHYTPIPDTKPVQYVSVTYKAFFTSLGIAHTSVDINGKDGALKLDLRQPLALGTFDMVTNIGTTEHVVNKQDAVWKNIVDATKVGGFIVSVTPRQSDWWWHGFWYPDEEWYQELCARNALAALDIGEYGIKPNRCVYLVAQRTAAVEFVMPTRALFKNTIRPRERRV